MKCVAETREIEATSMRRSGGRDWTISNQHQRVRVHINPYGLFYEICRGCPDEESGIAMIAKIIVEKICSVYGSPLRLFTEEMCQLLKFEKIRTTSYEARTNGMIERYHRTMNSMIGKIVSENDRNWHEILLFVGAAYRESVHEYTGFRRTTYCSKDRTKCQLT